MSEHFTKVAHRRSEVRRTDFSVPRAAVYTMGALHEGHLELVRTARAYLQEKYGQPGEVVVSIFVNPTQFNNAADLAKYPRTLEADLEKCEGAGVDIVFAPTVDEMYPGGTASEIGIDPGSRGEILEGLSRPGHFRGVLTVVNKLTNLMSPDVMFFGEKDFQQLTLITAMADELAMATTVIGVETVRDEDGLAKSSRNVRLSSEARAQAAVIPAALRSVQTALSSGATPHNALAAARAELATHASVELDYLVITNNELFDVTEAGTGRVLIAAHVGGVRLIDNMPVQITTLDTK